MTATAKVLKFKRPKQQQQPRRPASQRTDAVSTELRKRQRKLSVQVAREVRDWAGRGNLSERLDSWQNMITKVGVPGDKRLGGLFMTDRLVDLAAEDIWRGDDMAGRAIETIPDTIVRAGWSLNVQAPGDASSQVASNRDSQRADMPTAAVFPPKKVIAQEDTGKEIAEAMDAAAEELGVAEVFGRAMRAERGYGGAAILLGVDDGEKDWSKPLKLNRVKTLDWLDVLTPLELIPYQWYSDPMKAKYGQPELFWMQRIAVGNLGATTRVPVHESRLIRFGGVVVSRRQLREHWGWGDSILVRMQEVLRDFQSGWQASAVLLADFAQMIIKIKGLAEAIASGNSDLLQQRLIAIDQSRSVARAVVIDGEEEAGRQPTPITGLPDMLDRFSYRLAAAARMPVTILMGRSPAGLNATGESDVRGWYDEVDGWRKLELLPKLRYFFRVLFNTQEGPTAGVEPQKWGLKFGHLWQPTEKEQADARYSVAQADGIYVDRGVVLAGEVAKSRFGGDDYSPDTQLDQELRNAFDKEAEAEAAAAAAELQQNAEGAPAAPGAPAPGETGAPKQPKTSTVPVGKDTPGPKNRPAAGAAGR